MDDLRISSDYKNNLGKGSPIIPRSERPDPSKININISQKADSSIFE